MNIREITREELYEQVWSEPLIKLSKKYDLSDNGLRKWCKKIDIPLPKAGHWAKIQHGYKVKKPKLPKMTKEAEKADRDRLAKVNYYPLREKYKKRSSIVGSPYIERLRELRTDFASEIKTLENIKRFSPAVVKAKKSLFGKEIEDSRYDGMYRTGKGVVNIFSSESLFKRSLKLMESFIRLMKKRGHTIIEEDSKVVVFGEEISFGIREKMKSVIIANPKYSWNSRELHPKGILSFYMSCSRDKEWIDKTKLVEERLLEIIAYFEENALKSIQERKEYARKQVIRNLQDFVRQEKRRRREEQILNVKRLIRDSEIWKRAQIVREYIEAIEAVEGDHKFVAWAKEKIDWFDPFTKKDDRLLDDQDRERILKELNTEHPQTRMRSNWSNRDDFWRRDQFWK